MPLTNLERFLPVEVSLGLFAVGTVISTIELFSMLPEYAAGGAFYWKVYSSYPRSPAIGKILTALFSKTGVAVLLAARLACGLLVGLFSLHVVRTECALMLAVFLLTSILLRYGSPYAVLGSDSMLIVVGAGLFVFELQQGSPWSAGGLWFIAAQSCLSYLVAGANKLASSAWRNGDALLNILSTAPFGNRRLSHFLRRRKSSSFVSWSVICFEMAFPIVIFTPPKVVVAVLIAGTLFHCMNAYFMGMNNFVWSFLASYPILWICNREWFMLLHRS